MAYKVTEVIYKKENDFCGTLIPIQEKELEETFNSEGEALEAVGADEGFFMYNHYMGGWQRLDTLVDDSSTHSVYRIEEVA